MESKSTADELDEISKELEENKQVMRKELGFSFEQFELSELLKPPAAFVDEMLKIFDIKNNPIENNFENKFREKRNSDIQPYFNFKQVTPDDSLNDTQSVESNRKFEKCEIQIYKIDKPFFLRPCSSFKKINWSLDSMNKDNNKIMIAKKKRWTSESPVKKYINENRRKSNLKNSSMNNLSEKKELRFENLKTALSCSELNDEKKFDFDKFKIKKTERDDEKASKIPIRKGSSLERKQLPQKLASTQKGSSPNLTFKNYNNIFDHMKQIDKSNRLANLFKYRSNENLKVIL